MSSLQTDTPSTLEIAYEESAALQRQRKSQLRLIAERFARNKVAVVGLVSLAIISVLAILAPLITHQTATFNPADHTDLGNALAGPSLQHLLGTDDVGRDEFARLLFGARVSLLIGTVSMLVTIFIGVTIGALAGYYGGWVDNLIMRITDAFLAVPLYFILFVLSASFSNGSVQSIVVLLAAFSWAITARIVRSEFLSIKEREFILAARTLGASDFRLMLRHILPNAVGPIIVNATLLIGSNIITESTLSFFGFGLQPPLASWGTMLADSQDYISTHPVLVFVPGIAILITVLSFNLMGDGLRDALDPYMTER